MRNPDPYANAELLGKKEGNKTEQSSNSGSHDERMKATDV